LQDVLISVVRNIKGFNYDPRISSFKRWLSNITRWRITSQIRSKIRRSLLFSPMGDDEDGTNPLDRIAAPDEPADRDLCDAKWGRKLLEAVVKTGVPVVLALQNGRALTIPWAAAHVPAILEAWYPGDFGGRAIAETLFGDNNPAGRLPVSFPKSVGQLPVFYDHFPSKSDNYIEGNDSPQFVFGFDPLVYSNLLVDGVSQLFSN